MPSNRKSIAYGTKYTVGIRNLSRYMDRSFIRENGDL